MATAETKKTARPVRELPIEFTWYEGDWYDLFERQIVLIQDELKRAQAEDRVIVYLSCPISSRGGGHSRTNVEVALHTARRLMNRWGERFYILNPAQYQMESKEGAGLFERHAEDLKIDSAKLKGKPEGGDYMRMWTRVLAEDKYLKRRPPKRGKQNRAEPDPRPGMNLGGLFDAFYFLAPSDVHDFFVGESHLSVTAAVEEYFARKYAADPEFRKTYDFEELQEEGKEKKDRKERPLDLRDKADAEVWESKRKEFFRFYAVRASANYSLGSHDEWNILQLINAFRLASKEYGMGEQIAGYYDGKQIAPGAAEMPISNGYGKVLH